MPPSGGGGEGALGGLEKGQTLEARFVNIEWLGFSKNAELLFTVFTLPIIYIVCPLKNSHLITNVFKFFWVLQSSPRETEDDGGKQSVL